MPSQFRGLKRLELFKQDCWCNLRQLSEHYNFEACGSELIFVGLAAALVLGNLLLQPGD